LDSFKAESANKLTQDLSAYLKGSKSLKYIHPLTIS
jgi:hypothetical protein